MKRLVNWIKFIFSAIVLVSFSVTAFFVLSGYFREEPMIEKQSLDALEEDVLDVVAFGSSQMQYSFSPEMFKEMSGLDALVMGSGCQNLSVSLAAMKTMFLTQSPQYVLVDVFTATNEADNACYTDQMVYNGSLLTDRKYRVEALKGIKDHAGEHYYDFVFDLSFTHDQWKEEDFIDEKTTLKSIYSGYIPKSFDADYTYTPVAIYNQDVTPIDDLTKSYIDQMLAICKENNAKLVLIKVPTDLQADDQAKVRGILQYGKDNGAMVANYIDDAESIQWFFGRDGDTYHNNIWGAYKVTKAISELLLSDNASLSARKESDTLTNDYRLALNQMSMSLVHNNDDIYSLMDEIDLLNLNCVLIYKGGRRNIMLDSEYKMLEAIGFDPSPLQKRRQSVQVVNEKGQLIYKEALTDQIQLEGLSLTIDNNQLIYGNKTYTFGDDNFILFIYDSVNKQATLNSVDTVNQIYFWSSACYQQACAFVN